MAKAEEADMAHAVLAARRHCLEMATRLVEPPIDYLESEFSCRMGQGQYVCPTL